MVSCFTRLHSSQKSPAFSAPFSHLEATSHLEPIYSSATSGFPLPIVVFSTGCFLRKGNGRLRVDKKFVLQTKCVTIIRPINSKYCVSLSMVASNRFLVLLGKSCFTKTAYYVNTFLPNIHIMETKTRKITLKAFLKFIQFPTEFQVPNSL